MKFTGHERDLADPNGAGDDLDYMHARSYSPLAGRFLGLDRHVGHLRLPQSWNRYAYVTGSPLKFVDPDGQELEAFYLATGTTDDLTRHSAVYFRDDQPGSEMDIVFSNGGIRDGVQTLGEYLSGYGAGDPTTAYHLSLSSSQTRALLQSFKDDWVRSTENRLMRIAPDFNMLTNDCAQYACRKVIAASSSWDSVQGALSEVINIIDKVDPMSPVPYTNDALRLLRVLGLLGGVEKNLRSPADSSTNVIVYWSYNPPSK
jgi:RHS repeat-associated protein